jgi:hypothetical protein
MEVFSDKLQVQELANVEEVQPEKLLELFYKGDVVAICQLNEYDVLEFDMEEEKLIACMPDSLLPHLVTLESYTPKSFIAYTMAFYSEYKKSLRRNTRRRLRKTC